MFKDKIQGSATLLIVAAALCRLIPHWPNFTPVIAIALVGGVMMQSRMRAILVPLAAMLLSDIILGLTIRSGYAFHATQWAVYGSIVCIALFGELFKTRKISTTVLLGGTVSAVFFFITTNFAVWLSGGLYPLTMEGLVASYVAGLAFYRDGGNFLLNGLFSTWLYASVIILGVASVRKFAVQPQ